MRNAFADEITKLAAEDPRIVLLSGDIGNKLFDRFKEVAPTRFFNCGVAEANMMGVAAGLALSGLRPVVYTITPFTTTRCYEQIRVDACYHSAPVVIVGTGSGLSYAELGPTHHSLEDLAILRVLPGMTVLAPCDQIELRTLLRLAFHHDGPVYMRIGKKGEPILNKELASTSITIGQAVTLRDGDHVCLIVAGPIASEAIGAAELLAAKGITARIESFHTIKPLDEKRLDRIFRRYPLVAVVEEHSRIGGLGGAIAEWRARQPSGSWAAMLSFGSDDEFMHEVGSQEYARRKYGLTADSIAEQVCAVLRQ
ncbi:MAG TPA: transketolase C-terminal domain-containing protein [Chryseosolibacter sp.]|nr:transketolase C-terminal domain-containing protein [Chryseosolibacter sp.]